MKVKATANYRATVQHPTSGLVVLSLAEGEDLNLDADLVELVNHDRPGTLVEVVDAPAPRAVVAPAKTRQVVKPPAMRSVDDDEV